MHCPYPGPSSCPFLAQRGGGTSRSMKSSLRGEQLPGPPFVHPQRTQFRADHVTSCKPDFRTPAHTHLLTRPAPDKPLVCLGHLALASGLPQSPALRRRRSSLTGGTCSSDAEQAGCSRALSPASSFTSLPHSRPLSTCPGLQPRPAPTPHRGSRPPCHTLLTPLVSPAEAAAKALAHSTPPPTPTQACPPVLPTWCCARC